MPVTINDFTYTNGNSGRTRINAAGLIVGVDFSNTSNTIATGPKTFTLTATANVNRDWVVGSAVVAVAQAGATGSLIGTVTTYTPSTQSLVIEVTSITGSGTGTEWRIGSTGFRSNHYDPITFENKGQLIEGGMTNGFLYSQDFTNAYWTKNNGSVGTKILAPDGTLSGDVYVPAAGTAIHSVLRDTLATASVPRTFIFALKNVSNARYVTIGTSTTAAANASFDLDNLQVVQPTNTVYGKSYIFDAGGGWRWCVYQTTLDRTAFVAPTLTFAAIGRNDATTLASTEQLGIWGAMFIDLIAVNLPSYIPTTTVSVTRAADQLSVSGTNFSQFYNSAQGTLVMELTPIAQAVGAVAGSLNDGTLNNAIRIQQKQSGTLYIIRKMATDGVTDVMAVNAATGNTLRSNGVDYTEVATQSANAQFGVASSSLGNFLSAGASENFRNSNDSGLTYNARTIGGTFNGAHFGIGRFVLAGSTSVINGVTVGSVIVSTDGLAFRRVNISGLTQNLNEVTSNGTNQYVAVGNGGVIYTSPDAETWTPQTSGTANNITGVSFFSGRYVAATIYTAGSAIRYSDDGITWVAATASTTTSMIDVAHNGTNLWVVVGGGGAIFTSSDGISYTSRTSNVATTLRGIHFADSLWVAVGDAGTVVTSPDGITWTDRTANSGTTQNINEVGFFNGKFYYVGNAQAAGENTAANIVANVTWTARTSNVGSNLNGIATNGSRLLICGSSGAITTSDDGTTFISRTGNAAQLNGAAFGNGTYVVVGNAINGSGLIATVNPTTFEYQRRVSGTTAGFTSVRFINGNFVAVRNSGVSYSTNALSWQQSAVGIENSKNDVAFGAGVYVVVGTLGTVETTTDFTLLTSRTSQTTQNLNGIDFANSLFVAVGNAGTVITSPNGTTWTLRTSGVTSTLHSVMYSTRDNQWYAAGDGGVILRATDPTGTWTSIANDATVGIFTAGALQANPLAGKFIPNVKNRVAIGWTSTGGVSISINGGDVVTDPSVTMPVLTQYSVGMNGLSGQHWNSTIKTQRAYRVRVSDDELKALSRV